MSSRVVGACHGSYIYPTAPAGSRAGRSTGAGSCLAKLFKCKVIYVSRELFQGMYTWSTHRTGCTAWETWDWQSIFGFTMKSPGGQVGWENDGHHVQENTLLKGLHAFSSEIPLILIRSSSSPDTKHKVPEMGKKISQTMSFYSTSADFSCFGFIFRCEKPICWHFYDTAFL